MTATVSYLGVRYAESQRPFTTYPTQLATHLTTQYLEGHRGGRLLDLGSGRGEMLHAFAQLGFRAEGVDRERVADARFPERVREADLEQGPLPYDDGSFDVVFSKSVLEHLRCPTPALREAQRVLAPGGRLVLMVPDFTAQWRHFWDDWTHVHPYTLIGLRECAQSHGFVPIVARHFRQLPFLWERPYLRVVADIASLLPDAAKRSKLVRFSKEWMLLVVADKPREPEGEAR